MRNRFLVLWERLTAAVFLRNQSLALRLLVFSALIVLVPLSIIGLISYRESSYVLEKQARESSWQIIEQVKTHMEYYITDFEIDSIKLLNQPEMKQLLQMESAAEIERSGLRETILQLINETAYSRSDISRITVLLDHKLMMDTDQPAQDRHDEEITREDWYSKVPTNGDIKLVSRTIRVGGRMEPVISMMKRLIHPYTLEPVGMLMMDINFKRIQEISDKVTVGRTGYLSIMSRDGEYMYHPDLLGGGRSSGPQLLEQMRGQEYGFFQTGADSGEYITFGHSPYLSWYFLTTYPEKELLQGVYNLRVTITLTVVITLVLVYLLGIGFAASLVRPIRRLQLFMNKVKKGDLKARARVESQDELGQLTMGFNNMVERLEISLEEIYISKLRETDLLLRQSETELKVLQSQLNPHFLFNSLETIRGMALERGMKDISTMSAALAGLLRYNLNNQSPYVTLKEELAVCQMYLRIQKYRFEEKLDYELDIPEWALPLRVLKFSLQPLIENCVIHGVEPSDVPVRISIKASQADADRLVVCIRDTGMGISPDRLEHIRMDMQERDILSGGSHIGIVNVHRRLTQLFGADCGLAISSLPGQGTEIQLYMPMRGEPGGAGGEERETQPMDP